MHEGDQDPMVGDEHRGVEAAETGESDAQFREGGTRERWDSRRGSVRHTAPYRA